MQLQADNLGLLFRLADASLAIANACIRLYSCVVLAIYIVMIEYYHKLNGHTIHMITSHDGISSHANRTMSKFCHGLWTASAKNGIAKHHSLLHQ